MKSDIVLDNLAVSDCSRLFFEMAAEPSYSIRERIRTLDGAKETGCLTGITEMWLDFYYAGYRFVIHDSLGTFRFFVAESQCPESVLLNVADHFSCH
jgi:hypothetical protein